MTSEGEVYIWTKQLFRADGWTVLASDPPRGTDVPRLEIKQPGDTQALTKNKNAIINDLVYAKDGVLALIECKDSSDKVQMDVEKLHTLLTEQDWRDSLVTAMSGRSLFSRDGTPNPPAVRDGSGLVAVLAYPGVPRSGLARFVQVTFNGGDGSVQIGEAIPPTIADRMGSL